MYLVQL